MLINSLKIILIIIVSLFILLLIFMFAFRPLTSYLVRPSNLKKAAENGEFLLSQTNKNVFVVTAHPDDAEWYSGGTLARLAEKNNVFLVLGTSGEKGASGNNIGKIREEKQKKAAKFIGYRKVFFLRNPDRGLKNDKKFKQQINEMFLKTKPDIVFTFDPVKQGPIYHHPDHLAAGQAATAVVKYFEGANLYYFHSSSNNTVVEFSPVKQKKSDALQALFNYGRPGLVQTILRILSFGRSRQFTSGMNESYPSVGIKDGELFRKKT